MPVRVRLSANKRTCVKEYLPIIVFLVLALAVSIIPVVLAKLVAPSHPSRAQQAPFECGFPSEGDMRVPFDIQYYLVAILFILFDLETAFLFPWAVAIKEIGWFGFSCMMVFLGILTIGFLFEWKMGALDWK